MKCPICGRVMKKSKGSYRYVESGLDNIILSNIPIYTCACGETMPEIPHVERLHRLIASGLIKKKTLLTGKEIRFLRKEMGLGAKELAAVLGANPVTVSKWETGMERIGTANDRLIRMMYMQTVQEQCQAVFKGVISELRDIKPKEGRRQTIIIPASDLEKDQPCLV
ncbi:MAG: type II toxin-antitoxin system MqsA family antitoxin [Nitrospiraceae bacterium]|nr:type II toxin-antitoxin system MqsA family antitoxin [Nitrospiraceae bacterium]